MENQIQLNQTNQVKSYSLVAKIDKENELVFTFLNDIDFTQYQDKNNITCDCCNTNHYRKYTYIIQDLQTNKILQVGKSCLSNLLNLKNLSERDQELLNNNDMEKFNNYKNKYINTIDFIKKLVIIQDLHGFNNDIHNKVLTYKLTKQDDKINIDTLLNYYKNYNKNNEFITNIKNLIIKEYFDIKYINIIKYAYQSYLKNLEFEEKNNILNQKLEDKQKELKENEKIQFIIKSIEFLGKGNYSISAYNSVDYNIYKIIDTNDNIYELNTSKELLKEYNYNLPNPYSYEIIDLTNNYINKKVIATFKKFKKTLNDIITVIKNIKIVD